MELIVRTAHGTADVSVDVRDSDLSLRDVIAAVTGQAAPDTARVDGRLVTATDVLDACGVRNGSVVDTLLDSQIDSLAGRQPGNPAASTAPVVAVLRQVTGPGAGRFVPLSVGDYRIGPGRRQLAEELSSDAAEVVAFELSVTSEGVSVSPPRRFSPTVAPLSLAGADIDGPTPWERQHLVAAGRVFRLDERPPADDLAPPRSVDGQITHNRPPGIVDEHRTIAEAVDDARIRAPRLWHRRTDDGVVSIDVGLLAPDPDDTERAGALEPVTIDVGADRVTAVIGPSPDREALARSVLVDCCTRYGPADLDIVIASSPGELEHWDWAKWLPHIRWGASVDLLTNDLEMASFAGRQLERPTLVIVTADDLWSRADGPLRSVVIDGMSNASVLVLTDDHRTAPSSATNLITLDTDRPGAASLDRFTRDGSRLEMFVPLIDTALATDVARHLAPLVDPDRMATDPVDAHPLQLGEIVGVDQAAQRWDTGLAAADHRVEMPVGSVAGVTVGVDVAVDTSVAISGSNVDEATGLATVLTLSAASTWSPSEVSLLIVDHRASGTLDPLRDLPHHAGTFAERDAASIDRLLARLRDHLVGEAPNPARVMVLINGLAETELAAHGLVEGLSRLADEASGMHLVVATARPLAALPAHLRALCHVEIAVDGYGGIRRATLHDRRRGLQTPFTPYDETSGTGAEAVGVRPFVFGRRPSALERRLERGEHLVLDSRDSVVARLVRQLADLAELQHRPRAHPLVPVPLPARLLASELWSANTGDGVPLGVIDAVDAADPTTNTVDWWLPGAQGSRLLVGSPRSGVRSALEVLLVGVVDRFATDDVQIVAIEQNERRRTAMAAAPHVVQVASPDHAEAVEALLADIARTMVERIDDVDFRVHDHPTILVLARDIERLGPPALATLTGLFADGAPVGINVVASAARPVGIETVVDAARRVLVGSLSDTGHYARLHVEHSAAVDRHVARAQQVDTSGTADDGSTMNTTVVMVQLAELDASFESTLDALVAMMDDET